MKLTVDNRVGIHNQDAEIDVVEKNEAIGWIKSLDGARHTLLNLERADGVLLMVGGGPDKYVVTLNDGDESLVLKNSKDHKNDLVELCAGGQYGEYPEEICVDLGQAADAVSMFFDGYERRMEWA